MSESLTRFIQKSGGSFKWIATLIIGGAAYYSSIELVKSQVSANTNEITAIKKRASDDHDIIVEIRTDQRLMRGDIAEIKQLLRRRDKE